MDTKIRCHVSATNKGEIKNSRREQLIPIKVNALVYNIRRCRRLTCTDGTPGRIGAGAAVVL